MTETNTAHGQIAKPEPKSTPFEVRSFPETRADSARVETDGYESLNAEQTKEAFTELDSVLNGLADTAIHTLDQMIPFLAQMQSLLSQRGSARKRVLNAAGLPCWTEWATSFAEKFDCSLRTLQDHIKIFRRGKSSRRGNSIGAADKRLKLDARQQSDLVKAQLATNDLVSALKNDGDWRSALAEYEKVAVSPAKLDSFVDVLSPEPDWKSVLSQFVATLEQHCENLSVPVMAEIRSVQELLASTLGTTQPDQPVIAVENEAGLADVCEPGDVEPNDVSDESKPTFLNVQQQTPAECSDAGQPDSRKPVASVKVTKYPPMYETAREGNCERNLGEVPTEYGAPEESSSIERLATEQDANFTKLVLTNVYHPFRTDYPARPNFYFLDMLVAFEELAQLKHGQPDVCPWSNLRVGYKSGQKMDSVAAAIRESALNQRGDFHYYNRGILMIADSGTLLPNGSVELTFRKDRKRGVINGGTTIQVINELLEQGFVQSPGTQYVRLEVLCGDRNNDEVNSISIGRHTTGR